MRPKVRQIAAVSVGLAGAVIVLSLGLVLSQRVTPSACGTEPCKEARQWIALAITAAIFVGGLYQYWKAQKWQRAEWVAKETESFFADKKVMNALYMLDWNARRLPLLLDATETPDQWFDYRLGMLRTALYSPSTVCRDSRGRERPYTQHELAIRDCFDRLFDRLERFEIFLVQGLVSAGELHPYLHYWMRLIGDSKFGRKPPSLIERRLWTYIDDYGFHRVQGLARRFGYDIVPVERHSK